MSNDRSPGAPLMRADLRMNDPVSITLPAHVWWALDQWYRSTPPEVANWTMREVTIALQDQILDPDYLLAQTAMQEGQEEAERANHPLARLARATGMQFQPLLDEPCPGCGFVVCVCPDRLP